MVEDEKVATKQSCGKRQEKEGEHVASGYSNNRRVIISLIYRKTTEGGVSSKKEKYFHIFSQEKTLNRKNWNTWNVFPDLNSDEGFH
jgi:hypothetical protein